MLIVADTLPEFSGVPKSVVLKGIRQTLDHLRKAILESDAEFHADTLSEEGITEAVKRRVQKSMRPNLTPLVNATGIVIHTNLGRSLLAREAVENLMTISSRYSNLEFDLSRGKRGSRYVAVEDILCEISGAESAMVVNNNAGAVLISLETLASGHEVIVSRGELVEIGGSFRIPDVMAKSGCMLKEVGTTNRTHPGDYIKAITPDTALLMKVHASNYSVIGFTAEVSLKELVDIGRQHNVPVMEDLGSGSFIDLGRYGLMREPTVQESVASGADVVTFSGDKLLGGPQAGIIVGKKALLDKIKKNPINRALRIDKMTLAALESTFRLYRDPELAVRTIPTLRMITEPLAEIEKKCRKLVLMLEELNSDRVQVRQFNLESRAGGGSLPMLKIPTKCAGLRISGMTVNAVERYFRNHVPPIIGRIEDDFFMMDLRTVHDDELTIITAAIDTLLKENRS
jgi:L-seryl-tRNA(Ser) seleniumtransferase